MVYSIGRAFHRLLVRKQDAREMSDVVLRDLHRAHCSRVLPYGALFHMAGLGTILCPSCYIERIFEPEQAEIFHAYRAAVSLGTFGGAHDGQ